MSRVIRLRLLLATFDQRKLFRRTCRQPRIGRDRSGRFLDDEFAEFIRGR